MTLKRLLAREQRAYLHRDRQGWEDHLVRARAFFEEGLRKANPSGPVLILGAGTGLEIPWELAPPGTTGWDADPWSRLGTALRHRRWPQWEFEDFTGGFQELEATLQRTLHLPNTLARRPSDLAARRLAGLVPSLKPQAAPLRRWIQKHRPGTILVANVLGQLGCLAERLVETAFQPVLPWEKDPDALDPLAEALDAWTGRAIKVVCETLRESGASLWMLHDRAVIHGDQPMVLGPLAEDWAGQIKSASPLEVSDPLVGLDLLRIFEQRSRISVHRWIWPVGEGQQHLMEALAFEGCSAQSSSQGSQTI
jgi:hypothetical protein